jgi:GT2 family glycosyltransferase
VGDYARILAAGLEKHHGLQTTFVVAAAVKAEGSHLLFRSHAGAGGRQLDHYTAIVLHYVNYAYGWRGVPLWLPRVLRRLQRSSSAPLVTVFHELYASGSWRQSAFWLRPMQVRIARTIAAMSEVSVVSSEVSREQLKSLGSGTRIIVHPVVSNLGEPVLSSEEIAGRDPHRWIICGGTELIGRSIRSFLRAAALIAEPFAPRELFVIGGSDKPGIRQALDAQKAIRTYYHPEVDAKMASEILAACAFGWIDYFHRPDVPTPAILKSGAFAAYCAHGVIPVFPSRGSTVALRHDALPGPFFVASTGQELPTEAERPLVAREFYSWYGRNASAVQLAATIAPALGQPALPSVQPEVDLFVVHWNQSAACIATVNALRAQGVPLRVTVIDNDSEAEALEDLQAELDSSVMFVRLEQNKGWGGALNVALQHWLCHETNPYCFISAHDAIPDPDCLRLLVAAAVADPGVGIVCPQYPEQFVPRLSRWRGVYPAAASPRARGVAQEVDVPHGTLMLVRRECLDDIGLFDERYFAYGDEHELGARAVRLGWKVVLVWGSVVTNPATSTESSWRSYLFARNSLFLVHDYFGRTAATLRAILILANTSRLLASNRESGFPFSARSRWRAVRDYFAGRSGRPVVP